MVYKFFDKKNLVEQLKKVISNKELAEELHKPIISKFEKRKVQSSFMNNIFCIDLADMQLISKFSKRFGFLLCVIKICSKHTWVIPLKDKKAILITNAFQKILDESNCKSNKIWVDKGSEFYNTSMKSFLQNNVIEMYSIHNEGKSVIAEIYYKYMISISKNMYIDKLDDIVNRYNTYSIIKFKPADVKTNSYFDSSKGLNDKNPKFKIVILLEYQNIKIFLQTVTLRICWKKFLWLKKVENAVTWT